MRPTEAHGVRVCVASCDTRRNSISSHAERKVRFRVLTNSGRVPLREVVPVVPLPPQCRMCLTDDGVLLSNAVIECGSRNRMRKTKSPISVRTWIDAATDAVPGIGGKPRGIVVVKRGARSKEKSAPCVYPLIRSNRRKDRANRLLIRRANGVFVCGCTLKWRSSD